MGDKLMEQKLIKFPNKFQAVICNVDSKMVSVSVSINVGAELEPKGKSGIAHLVERLIRSNIYSKVAEYGGVVDTKTDFEIGCNSPMKEIKARGYREQADDALYAQYSQAAKTPCTMTFIPYRLWSNRGETEMTVYFRYV